MRGLQAGGLLQRGREGRRRRRAAGWGAGAPQAGARPLQRADHPSRPTPAPGNVTPLDSSLDVNHHGRTVNHHGRTEVYFPQFLIYVFMRWKKRPTISRCVNFPLTFLFSVVICRVNHRELKLVRVCSFFSLPDNGPKLWWHGRTLPTKIVDINSFGLMQLVDFIAEHYL